MVSVRVGGFFPTGFWPAGYGAGAEWAACLFPPGRATFRTRVAFLPGFFPANLAAMFPARQAPRFVRVNGAYQVSGHLECRRYCPEVSAPPSYRSFRGQGVQYPNERLFARHAECVGGLLVEIGRFF